MKSFILVLTLFFSFRALAQNCEANNAAAAASMAAYCAAQSCPPSPPSGRTLLGDPTGFIGSFATEYRDVGGGYIPVYSCTLYNCSDGSYAAIAESPGDLCDQYHNSNAIVRGNVSTPVNRCGSIIQVENQVVGETIPLMNSSFSLNYFTTWSQGRRSSYKIVVPISGATPRDDITSFAVETKYNGVTVDTASYINTTPNVEYSYLWNGLDPLGNSLLGTTTFNVKVTEYHPSVNIPVSTKVVVGNLKARLFGLGGWLPSVLNFYDVNSKTLYKGDGSTKAVSAKVWNTTGYSIPEQDGSKVYYFSADGRHVYTKSGFLGATLYSFSYNGNGEITSIVEPFGQTTTFNRNSAGKFSSITLPFGQVVSVTLDGNDFLTSVTNPNSETYSMTYSGAYGLLATFQKPAGQVSAFTYDGDGNLTRDAHSGGYFFDLVKNFYNGASVSVSNTSKMGRTETIDTTFSSRAVSNTETLPDTRQRSRSFNYSAGYATESISDSGRSLSYTYQDDPRFGVEALFQTTTGFASGSVNYSWSHSQSVGLSDPNDPFSMISYSLGSTKGSFSLNSIYNPTTKTFVSSTGLGRTFESKIDAYERIVSRKVGALYALELTYTNQNLTKIKQDARETNLSYNPTTGFLSAITNPLSQTTSFTYDSAGRVATKIFPDLRVTSYSYDSNGNISGITPPSRPTHVFSLNGNELPSSYAPPTLTGIPTVNTTYAYNDDKQLTQILRPTGDAIDLVYGASTGVLQTVDVPGNTFSYTMNNTNGLPYYITSTNGPVTMMAYAGTIPTQYTTYTNGWASQISDYTMTLSSNGTVGSDAVTGTTTSTINYTYDNDEVLKTAGDMTFTYNFPNGLMTGATMGSGSTGFTDAYTYNSFGEMATYTAKRGTTTLYTLSLGRDGMGRINSKTEFMNAITNVFGYTFDSSGRLTQTDKNSTTVATYGYDDNSNRNSGTIGAQPTTATYNAQDWMTAYNTLSFTYNANGDLVTRTNTTTSTTTTYVYDVFGNLTSVTLPGGTVITYEIDALNRRIGKKVNGVLQKRWVYMDQTRIAAELSAAGAITKRFIYGSKGNIPDYMLVGSTKYRIISDHLGSLRLVVKQSDGSIAQRMNHDEYGRVTEDTNPGYLPFGFAGGLYDNQTGLVRFGARDYDSETGRWTSKDPILFGGGDTNLFGYVMQDPVNWVDTNGLKKTFVFQNGVLSLYDDNGGLLFEAPAKSGPWGNGALPKGNYSVGGMRGGRTGGYSCSGNTGYSLDLHPQFSTNRRDLRIHPDGGKPGTLGCIGVNCSNGAADALGEMLRGIYGLPMTPWIGLEVR